MKWSENSAIPVIGKINFVISFLTKFENPFMENVCNKGKIQALLANLGSAFDVSVMKAAQSVP